MALSRYPGPCGDGAHLAGIQVVTEFFGYAVNSILYQRGIYPPEDFQAVQKCPTTSETVA